MDITEWRDVVSKDWQRLRDAPSKVRGDRLAVLAAVRQSGWALAYAEPELHSDQQIVLEAARTSCREQAILRGEAAPQPQEDAEVDETYYQRASILLTHTANSMSEDCSYFWESMQWSAGVIAERASAALEPVGEDLVERAAVVGGVVASLGDLPEGLVEKAAQVGEAVDPFVQNILPAEEHSEIKRGLDTNPQSIENTLDPPPSDQADAIWRRASRVRPSVFRGRSRR